MMFPQGIVSLPEYKNEQKQTNMLFLALLEKAKTVEVKAQNVPVTQG